MKIGTDASLTICKNEGYMMAEFKKRELYIKGQFNPDQPVRFYAHYPDYIRKDIWGTENPVGVSTLIVDAQLSANDLWDLYKDDAKSIDSMVGESRSFPANEYDMLCLADEINAYKGLE